MIRQMDRYVEIVDVVLVEWTFRKEQFAIFLVAAYVVQLDFAVTVNAGVLNNN